MKQQDMREENHADSPQLALRREEMLALGGSDMGSDVESRERTKVYDQGVVQIYKVEDGVGSVGDEEGQNLLQRCEYEVSEWRVPWQQHTNSFIHVLSL
jgi:hypothetical protein